MSKAEKGIARRQRRSEVREISDRLVVFLGDTDGYVYTKAQRLLRMHGASWDGVRRMCTLCRGVVDTAADWGEHIRRHLHKVEARLPVLEMILQANPGLRDKRAQVRDLVEQLFGFRPGTLAATEFWLDARRVAVPGEAP